MPRGKTRSRVAKPTVVTVQADLKKLVSRVVWDKSTQEPTKYEFPDKYPSVLDMPVEFADNLMESTPNVFSVFEGDTMVEKAKFVMSKLNKAQFYEVVEFLGYALVEKPGGNGGSKQDDKVTSKDKT
jgi:hypothetical protein